MNTRRSFLTSTTAAAISAATHAFAAPTDGEIKIALIGCGGRGTGACNQALTAGSTIKLVAFARGQRAAQAGCGRRIGSLGENPSSGDDEIRACRKLLSRPFVMSIRLVQQCNVKPSVCENGIHAFSGFFGLP